MLLQKLQTVARDGTIHITHGYLGHIKKDEDRKVLAHAEAMLWEDVEPTARAVFEQHLFQAIEGAMGEVNFPCLYNGEVLSVAKVASEEFDRTQNRPAVELLEAIRDMDQVSLERMVEYGNGLAYKVLAAGAVKNHLLGILRLDIVPSLGAAPIPFVFATMVDLDDREESLLDERQGRFVVQELHNVIKKGSVSRAVFFPCLDQDGREIADLLVYAGSGAASWFKALEVSRQFNPRREGQALVRMITEQSEGTEVPHDLFRRMGDELASEASNGLYAESVATSLEKAMGRGIDRSGFLSRWESVFGDAGYRPTYESIFATDQVEQPTKLKMQAGQIQIQLPTGELERFRQITVGNQTFLVLAVPEKAKVKVGKDLDLQVRPVTLDQLINWLNGSEE